MYWYTRTWFNNVPCWYLELIVVWPSEKELHLVQRIQNTAARLIVSARSRDSINSLLKNLHWLPFENGFSRFVSRVLEHWLILLHLMYYNSVKLKPGPISRSCGAQSTNHFGQQTNRLPAKNQLHLYNVLLLAKLRLAEVCQAIFLLHEILVHGLYDEWAS